MVDKEASKPRFQQAIAAFDTIIQEIPENWLSDEGLLPFMKETLQRASVKDFWRDLE